MFRPPSQTPVRGLLRCLNQGFFVPSFEEEGYRNVADLQAAGQQEIESFMRTLGVKSSAAERLLAFFFEEASPQEEQAAVDIGGPPVALVGGCLDPTWLQIVLPLYAHEMGCENMGPLLHSLVRFAKPKICLEIGAGYTTAFLLQALESNHKEEQLWSEWTSPLPVPVGDPLTRANWLAPREGDVMSAEAVLHCVDNLAHAGTTAHRCLAVAGKLGLEHRLRLHLDDAKAFLEDSLGSVPWFDFIWLDGLMDVARSTRGLTADAPRVLTKGTRLSEVIAGVETWGQALDNLLDLVWPRLRAGGLLVLHSTLTNLTVRSWIEGVDGKGPPGGAVLSLFEPVKKFQNSCTLIQKRPAGWEGEPIYSKFA